MSEAIIILDSSDSENEKSNPQPKPAPPKTLVTPIKNNEIKKEITSPHKVNVEKLQKPALYINKTILVKKNDMWHKGIIIDIVVKPEKTKYKVRIEGKPDFPSCKVLVKENHLAYQETMNYMVPSSIPLGARIVADYNGEGLYSAIVAEPPSVRKNKNRFLVFYDDGCAMYCSANQVYLVCKQLKNVWEDIVSPGMSHFIQEYLRNCHNQPKLSVKVNQVLNVEFDGDWHKARCVMVDCSLLQVIYMEDKSTEWIYRGSLRLEPLFNMNRVKKAQLANNPNRKMSKIPRAHTGARRVQVDFIDLTRETSPDVLLKGKSKTKRNVGVKSAGGMSQLQKTYDDDDKPEEDTFWQSPWERINKNTEPSPIKTSLWENSYSEAYLGKTDISKHLFERFSKIQSNGYKRLSNSHEDIRPIKEPKYTPSVVVISSDSEEEKPKYKKSTKSNIYIPTTSAAFTKHKCSLACVAASMIDNLKSLRLQNPLKYPLLFGWTREIGKTSSNSRVPSYQIYYRAPCGKLCRNMQDICRYIEITEIEDLDFDHFCFDSTIRVYCSYNSKPRNYFYYLDDYSGGAEPVPISCVNEVNKEVPPMLKYSVKGVPEPDVFINKSKEFMVCCDCTDNCANPMTCPCQNLTIQYAEKVGKDPEDVGYKYKRLYNFLQTGIYECNINCKCNKQCTNRVVQKGLQHRLQLFRTQKKGWGIRCLDDIAKGSFVCVYVGKIQNDNRANEDGLLAGDEYLAELDHIEVAEREKAIDDGNASSSGVESEMEDNDQATKIEPLSDTTDSDIENDLPKFTKTPTPTKNPSTQGMKLFGLNPKYSNLPLKKTSAHQTEKIFPKVSLPKLPLPMQDSADTTDTESDDSLDMQPKRKQVAKKTTQQSYLMKPQIQFPTPPEEDVEDDYISKTRKYYGSSDMFIINAKHVGNLGRYLNHSCSPNLMVQNVFIDTQDLRFPWVAFFTNKAVRAGTELTWDYNYEVGSIPGRSMECHCGSTKCRKRLL